MSCTGCWLGRCCCACGNSSGCCCCLTSSSQQQRPLLSQPHKHKSLSMDISHFHSSSQLLLLAVCVLLLIAAVAAVRVPIARAVSNRRERHRIEQRIAELKEGADSLQQHSDWARYRDGECCSNAVVQLHRCSCSCCC